jgi:hypothetical protein
MKGRWRIQDGARVFIDAHGVPCAVTLRDIVGGGYAWFSGRDSGWSRTLAEANRAVSQAWEREKGGAR